MTGDPLTETATASRKVLLVYTSYSTFVQADHEMLVSANDVTLYCFRPVKGAFATLRELLRQLFFLLVNISRFNLILIWFADTHAFLPVWFGRWRKIETAIVIGGFDAVSFPHLKYGLFCSNPVRQFLGKNALRNAHYLLPVHISLVDHFNRYDGENETENRQGIKNFVKKIRGLIIPVPTGYDSGFWNFDPLISRKNSVMTLGAITNWQRWYLKGCDLLLQMAWKMPQTEYHIYGITNSMMPEIAALDLPENFFLHGAVSKYELREIYPRHAVYAQFSLSEGLPNALCEAMLCGCIPVGSAVSSIPDLIKNPKLILNKKESTQGVRILHHALSLTDADRIGFRNEIATRFAYQKRFSFFKALLNNESNH